MTDYVCSFFRSSSFSEETVIKTLIALFELRHDFFPLILWCGSRDRLLIEKPVDFERSSIPKEYYIDSGAARIPFEGANGTEIVFTESSVPQVAPPAFDIEFSGATSAIASWAAADFVSLIKVVVAAFEPEYGYVADVEEILRPEHDGVRFSIDTNRVPVSLHWINYFGPNWVRTIGDARLKRVSADVPLFEWLDTGAVLFVLQNDRFEEANPRHVAAQKHLETLLGLKELHREHQSNGV